jgi:transposase
MKSRRVVVEFGPEELKTLFRWSTLSLASVRCEVRANMVLMAATGFTDRVIAQELDVGAPRVRRWVARYVRLGLTGLEKDAPRGGPPRLVSAQRVIELTTQTQPEAATHWSTRTMAKEAGARAATISRIWRSHGLKPHLSKTFKVSNDIRFEEKLADIVGL